MQILCFRRPARRWQDVTVPVLPRARPPFLRMALGVCVTMRISGASPHLYRIDAGGSSSRFSAPRWVNPVILRQVDKLVSTIGGDPAQRCSSCATPQTRLPHYLDVDYDLLRCFHPSTANLLSIPAPPRRRRSSGCRYNSSRKVAIACIPDSAGRPRRRPDAEVIRGSGVLPGYHARLHPEAECARWIGSHWRASRGTFPASSLALGASQRHDRDDLRELLVSPPYDPAMHRWRTKSVLHRLALHGAGAKCRVEVSVVEMSCRVSCSGTLGGDYEDHECRSD